MQDMFVGRQRHNDPNKPSLTSFSVLLAFQLYIKRTQKSNTFTEIKLDYNVPENRVYRMLRFKIGKKCMST